MDHLVCPDCGSADFKQRRYAVIEYGIRVSEDGYEYDTDEDTVVDGGDRDEPITCADCGEEYNDLSTELVTEQAYNDRDD